MHVPASMLNTFSFLNVQYPPTDAAMRSEPKVAELLYKIFNGIGVSDLKRMVGNFSESFEKISSGLLVTEAIKQFCMS